MSPGRLRNETTPIRQKFLVRSASGGYQVFAEAKLRPFSGLARAAFIDISDICAVIGCSARTVYRWIAEEGLEPYEKVGRTWVFIKGDFLDWWEENEPLPGRPPKHGR